MTSINKLKPKLRKYPQPPLSHPGATPDSGRAKRPPLGEQTVAQEELTPGDRVEGLGNFGKPTGEFGIVERANEDDAAVEWGEDRSVLLSLHSHFGPKLLVTAQKEAFMGGHFFQEIPCTICTKPVDLQTDLTADENGKAVHEDCYVTQITSSRNNPPAAMMAD